MKKINIQIKITVLFFILLLGFSYGISLYLTHNVEEKAYRIASKYVQGIPKLINESIGDNMIAGNRESIRKLISKIVNDDVVLGVHIFNRFGKLSSGCVSSEDSSSCFSKGLNFSKDYISKINQNMQFKEFSKKIKLENGRSFIAFYSPFYNKGRCKNCHLEAEEVIGVLNVNIDISNFINLFNEKANKVRKIMIAFSLLMTVILSFLVNYLIINPIRRLEKGMEKVSTGNFDVKINISSKDELENLANYFNQMVYSLKKANDQVNQIQRNIVHFDRLMTVGQLMASISHEIKNPLNSIMVTADILQIKCSEHDKKQELSQHLEDIIGDTVKIRDIVDQTLSFSKSGELHIEDICADEFMENLEVYTKRIIFFNSDFSFDIQKLDEFCKYKIQFNRVSLEQVFVNILKNAVESIPEGRKGFIKIMVEYDEGYMIFYVKDNGIGISKTHLPYIFKDFYTTKTSGTGLGLAIVKNLLEDFNSEIHIESEENVGTTVIIKIPTKICTENI